MVCAAMAVNIPNNHFPYSQQHELLEVRGLSGNQSTVKLPAVCQLTTYEQSSLQKT